MTQPSSLPASPRGRFILPVLALLAAVLGSFSAVPVQAQTIPGSWFLSDLTVSTGTGAGGTYSAQPLTYPLGSIVPPQTYASRRYETATVQHRVTHAKLTVTAKTSTPATTISVRNRNTTNSWASVTSGGTSSALPLRVGENRLDIEFTKGTVTQSYWVIVTREASPLPSHVGTDLLTELIISDGVHELPLKPNVANAAGLRGPGIYAVMLNPDVRQIAVTAIWTNSSVVGVNAGVADASGNLQFSGLPDGSWNNKESGTTKRVNLRPGNGVTKLTIWVLVTGTPTYQIYIYHNHDWKSANERLSRLELRAGN